MAEQNFMEFMMKTLKGINYGNITTTNRAYRWIQNNSEIDGPCLNFLKQYATENNLITQNEMNSFKQIMSEKQMPMDEAEVDKCLEEYFYDSLSEVEYENVDSRLLENEINKSEAYLKELEITKFLLQRQINKKVKEIEELKRRTAMEENKFVALLSKSGKINARYNAIWMETQEALTITKYIFRSLPENDIFRMDFEVFKQIIQTFKNGVNTVIENQFGKKHIISSTEVTGDITESSFTEQSSELEQKVVDLIEVAYLLGKLTHARFMKKCEEMEYVQLSNYLNDLLRDITSHESSTPTTAVRLKLQASANKDITDDLQLKSAVLENEIKKYHKQLTFQEILINEKCRMEEKFRNDKKCLRKVSDLCLRFVSLLVAQACFIANEIDNIKSALALHNQGASILTAQRAKNSNLLTMLEEKKSVNGNQQNDFLMFVADFFKLQDVNKSPYEMLVTKYENSIAELQNKIFSTAKSKMLQFQNLHDEIADFKKLCFNGPLNQPFFVPAILSDKRFFEVQYGEYNEVYQEFKRKYNDELENLSKDEYLRLERTLWISFLLDPKELQETLQTLRQSASVNDTVNMFKWKSMQLLAPNNSSCSNQANRTSNN